MTVQVLKRPSRFAIIGEGRIVAEREAVPIRVPIEAVFSRSDGFVAWRACIDHHSPHVHNHEVFSSHLGLVASALVFRLVAEGLAAGART